MKYDIDNMMKCGGIKLSVFVDFPKAFDTIGFNIIQKIAQIRFL